MSQRHNESSKFVSQRTHRRAGGFAMSAAALALIAGAPAALAQDEDGDLGLGLGAIMEAARNAAASATGRAAEVNATLGDTPAPAQPSNQPDEQRVQELMDRVRVDENMIVELHVQNEALANVLQLLSIQSQRNIVASQNVSATVSANLYGVTFYEALDAILHVNGFGYVEKGNFIHVYTLAELEQIEQASRRRVHKRLVLNYLNAVDAAEFVTPLLSEGSFIKTNNRTERFTLPGDAPAGADDFVHGATLIIFDYPDRVEEIEGLLRELDTRPAQVLVEATIVQTQLNEANAFGVDFSIIADLSMGDFVNLGGPLGSVDGLIGGTGSRISGGSSQTVGVPGDDGRGGALVSTAGNASGPATFKAGIVYNDVAVFLRMLDEVGDTTIISNPKILTLNRMPARVLVGRKVGYLSTTTSETSTTQTVQFLDTGTQLYFRPFVTNEGMIRMELKPQVSEAVIRNATDTSGSQVTIPDEITNELVTNVIVPDGHTIVLGGLFRESTSTSRRQVPFLGDIPIIGAAFRGHDDETQRNEIIFMIKPSIVSDNVMIKAGAEGLEVARRARAGAREGLLPWSREKRASMLLVEADRLAAEGKTDQALHRVRRSLELFPSQPDAIEMREKLMNERTVWPNRDLLHSILHGEVEELLHTDVERRSAVTPAADSMSVTSASDGVSVPDTADDSMVFVSDDAAQPSGEETVVAESTDEPQMEQVNVDAETGEAWDAGAVWGLEDIREASASSERTDSPYTDADGTTFEVASEPSSHDTGDDLAFESNGAPLEEWDSGAQAAANDSTSWIDELSEEDRRILGWATMMHGFRGLARIFGAAAESAPTFTTVPTEPTPAEDK
ncbi:MAG TPA: hypothetical protein PLU35_08760 [Phycisphaerales bacterium]|nr:hypothetical protein [Phycisphaerales bacterium]